MKMLSMLDMSGNQIKNFLVHNGDATSNSKLTAWPGRLVYDTTERSLYYGYDNASTNQTEWSRLIDEAHIGSYINQYAIPANKEVKSVTVSESQSAKTYKFNNSLGATQYSFTIPNATGVSSGLLSATGFLNLTSVYQLVSGSSSNWTTAYSWGNHAEAGYSKAYKIDKAVEASEKPLGGNTYENISSLIQSTGFNDWTQNEVVFDTIGLRLLCEYTRTYGGETQRAYVKSWNSYNTIKPASYYKSNETLLFVKGNATVYKRENNAWVLYFSGASQDVIEKIDDIRDALGIDEEAGGIINTWNEVKEFFKNIDNQEDLLSVLATKADADKVVAKPSNDSVAGAYLTSNGDGTTSWHQPKQSYTWTIGENSELVKMFSIPNTDVVIKMYKQTFTEEALSQGSTPMVHWTEVIADVELVSMSNAYYARVTFGARENGTYKAVIIGV